MMAKSGFKKSVIIAGGYIFLSLVCFVLFFARVYHDISPFAIAFLFACVFLKLNPYLLGSLSFISSLFLGAEHSQNVINFISILCFVAFYPMFHKYRYKMRHASIEVVIVVLAYIVSCSAKIAYAAGFQDPTLSDEFYRAIISVMVGCMFLGAMIVLVKTVPTRKGRIPWTHDQRICGIIFCIIFSLGLSGLDSDYFSIHKFLVVLIILIGVNKFCPRATMSLVVALGFGRSLATLNLTWIAIFAL